MKLIEFITKFPDEDSCRSHLKKLREKDGIRCVKCGAKHHYWKNDKGMWECKSCGHRTSLTSGTVMHASKLPLRYWFIAIHLLTATKKSFSAQEIQNQLGHKYYEPIWAMCHKLREMMGRREDRYLLGGSIEIDEGMFSSFCIGKEGDEGKKDEKKKRGRGSQTKSTVVVMVESEEVQDDTKPGRPSRKVGFIRMAKVKDSTSGTLNEVVGQRAENDSNAITDGHKGYLHLQEELESVTQIVASGADSCKVLPWVHICIANTKRWFLAIHHAISKDYIQHYLN